MANQDFPHGPILQVATACKAIKKTPKTVLVNDIPAIAVEAELSEWRVRTLLVEYWDRKDLVFEPSVRSAVRATGGKR